MRKIGFLLLFLVSCAHAQLTGGNSVDTTQAIATSLEDGGAIRIAKDITIQKIAPRAFRIVHEKPWPANCLLLEMENRTLVLVSTPYTSEATAQLLSWIKGAFGQRKIEAISTHFHWDGAGGNAVLQAARIPVYGTNLTAALIASRGSSLRAETIAQLANDPEFVKQFQETVLAPPDRIFDAKKGLELSFGNELLQIYWPGPGHAQDNLVVWSPGHETLFAGCIIKAGRDIGNITDADLSRWAESAAALRKFSNAKIVIPGHGEPGRLSLIDNTIEVIERARSER